MGGEIKIFFKLFVRITVMYLYGPSDYWLGLLGKVEADKNGQETIMPNTNQEHQLNSNRRKNWQLFGSRT